MSDFASENAALDRVWVQAGGIELLFVHKMFRWLFRKVE